MYIYIYTITPWLRSVTQGKCPASSKCPSRAEVVLDLREPNTSKPPGAAIRAHSHL